MAEDNGDKISKRVLFGNHEGIRKFLRVESAWIPMLTAGLFRKPFNSMMTGHEQHFEDFNQYSPRIRFRDAECRASSVRS